MPSNTKYNPSNINDFDKNKLNKYCQGVDATVITGTTQNIDYTLTDDVLLAGGSIFMVQQAAWGDKVSVQVLSGSTVLIEFVSNWPVNPDVTLQVLPQSNYPAKLYAGLTIRTIYTSVGLINNPKVAIGYNFEKVLI